MSRPDHDGNTGPSHPAESSRLSDSSHPGGQAGMPRWVKVSGVVLLVLAVLVVFALLSGHGPGMHGAAAGLSQPPALAAPTAAAWL